MTPKKHMPKCGISTFKKYELTDQSLSLRTTSQQRKNTDRIWEKNDLQKYLNVYESIEQRQNLINDQPYKQKGILHIKKYPQHKKSIFQNPLIQSSCSQMSSQDHKLYPSYVYHTQLNQSRVYNQQYLPRSTPVPSRKNQMALTMIGENKIFYTDQQLSLVMQGSNFGRVNERNKNIDADTFNFGDQLIDSKFYELNQKSNYFDAEIHDKQLYKGFYKTKYQKLYRKQSEQRLINSSNFIYGIDRTIENQKNREMIIRPKSSNPRSLIKRQTFKNNFIDGTKSLIFSSHEIPHKVQSQAKFVTIKKIQSKKQTNRLIKKSKNYLAHKRNYQPLRSFSYHPDDEKENRKIIPKLSITTETPLKQNFYLLKEKYFRYVRQPPKLNDSSASKTSLQKKVIKSGRIGQRNEQQTQKDSYQTTLNKIQDNIANDIQLSIRQLDIVA